jgi:transposase
MTLRDRLGLVFEDEAFAELFSHAGQRGLSPGMLVLVLVMQYMEGLTDEQAANAVRARIDWKYALGLELEDAGFDSSVLSTFRRRLLAGEGEGQVLERILQVAEEHNLLDTAVQRTDSTHVLAAVGQLNRLELVGTTLRAALEAVAALDEAWLATWLGADWVELYGERMVDYRLPQAETERRELALRIGADGVHLMNQVQASRPALAEEEALLILRAVWAQQYAWEGERLVWRAAKELPPPAERLSSPFDPAARAARKRQTQWLGYKVHLSESCSDSAPHLITQVVTTPSNEADSDSLLTIEQGLAARGLQPQRHYADSGYITAERLVQSRLLYQTELVGPLRQDSSWQARQEAALALADLAIDWQRQEVTCPAGYTCDHWRQKEGSGGRSEILVRFPQAVCSVCPLRPRCTRAKTRGRCLSFQPFPLQEAIVQRRAEQETAAFWQDYRRRAGVEATLSLAVRCFDLRRTRYRRPDKVHLQHLLIASAINLTRIVAWFSPPRRPTPHQSRLKQLPLAA